jgi:hypothetical protein
MTPWANPLSLCVEKREEVNELCGLIWCAFDDYGNEYDQQSRNADGEREG